MTTTTDTLQAPARTSCLDAGEAAYTVYAIVNGALGMSPGKVAAQTFQACQRLYAASRTDPALAARLVAWEACGTKTVTCVTGSPGLWERLGSEVAGTLMVDEGVNEVAPDSPTVLATFPLLREERPAALKHRHLKPYRGQS